MVDMLVAVVVVMELVAATMEVAIAEALTEAWRDDSSYQPHESLVLYDPSTQQPVQHNLP
ncbi:Retrovirus-related Pol polyprotein from transposon TNT 1-94 [Sesbania bispinosa]|nr:Retrovirus-related Pol polyprotein from transposon TNT 1-94 [Sesbania bispinosa]